MPLENVKILVDFNPRSREGSDNFRFGLRDFFVHFNPRSREGSDDYSSMDLEELHNFNPRSREGSDAERMGQAQSIAISIHAPARGATAK